MRELTEAEMLQVEMRRADFFFGVWMEVAEELGIDPTVPLSDEDDARVQAEFDRRYKQ